MAFKTQSNCVSLNSNTSYNLKHFLIDRQPILQCMTDNDDNESPPTYENVAYGCQVTLFVLAIIGTVTNQFSIWTLCSRSLRSQATSMGLIALAVADSLVLITCIFRYHVYYIFLNEEQYLWTKFTRDAYFQVYVEPIYWMSLGMSSFVVVAVTTQRYLAIRFPFATRRYSNKAINLTFLCIIMLVPVALTFPNFFYYRVVQVYLDFLDIVAHLVEPTEFGVSDGYRCVYLGYLLPILFYILPWIYLALINFLLVRHVHNSAKVSHSDAMATRGRGHGNRHSHNLTVLLILLVSMYMILNLPKCILVFMRLIETGQEQSCSPGTDGTVEIPTNATEVTNWIVTVLNVANSTVNFVLYCMFGERFRKEFKRKFLFCRCKCLGRFSSSQMVTGKSTTLIGGETVI